MTFENALSPEGLQALTLKKYFVPSVKPSTTIAALVAVLYNVIWGGVATVP